MELFYFSCVIVTSGSDAVTLESGNLCCIQIRSPGMLPSTGQEIHLEDCK